MSKRNRISVIIATILVVMLSTTVFAAYGLADSPSTTLGSDVSRIDGYPTAIPPDTKPDITDQDSKPVFKYFGGKTGTKGCMTTAYCGWWSHPYKDGNNVISYVHTYGATTCWQNPITRVDTEGVLWKWAGSYWVVVDIDSERRTWGGGLAEVALTYENAESGYYITTSEHEVQQGGFPILSVDDGESDYIWIEF